MIKRKTRRKPGSTSLMIAYGALYVDSGESLDNACQQIDATVAAASGRRPLSQVILIFDIVARPEHITSGVAHNLAVNILRYADDHYPGLYGRYVGITDDDARRPMRDIMLTQTLDEIDGVHLFVVEDYESTLE